MELFDVEEKFDFLEQVLPAEIEKKSFEIIRKSLAEKNIRLEDETEKIVVRAIHATADFDFAENLVFSKNAVKTALDSLGKNCVIVTDTNMALAGVSKKICKEKGIETCCFMADGDVALLAESSKMTRAACCVDKAAQVFKGRTVIYAVGNAPTALVRLRLLFDAGIFAPALVIACPVGFVNVVGAKNLILESKMESITAKGRKGGSTVAAAVLNALLQMSL